MTGQIKHMKCAVISPIGPGHQDLIKECAASVGQAKAHSQGPFSEIVHIAVDDTSGTLGRSRARNAGISLAVQQGADWIFFVDADDLLLKETFSAVADLVDGCDAIWGLIQEQRLGTHEPTIRRPQVTQINSLLALMAHDPYQTLQMGHFVRTDVAAQIRFDEARDFGEDFDYYLRLWHKHRCIKIPRPLFLNRIGHSASGPRSGDGRQWRPRVHSVIEDFARHIHLTGKVSLHEAQSVFTIPMPFDTIQTHHLAGKFHEQEELDYLRSTLPPGMTIADIGAHVGNHSVYLHRYLAPASITVFEPNERVIPILNDVRCADTSHLGLGLGLGLGACTGRAVLHAPDVRNTDRATLVRSNDGGISIHPLDALLDRHTDFLKIDVSGMEMDVLAGAASVMETSHPDMLISIRQTDAGSFSQWLEAHHYSIAREFRHDGYSNIHVRFHGAG